MKWDNKNQYKIELIYETLLKGKRKINKNIERSSEFKIRFSCFIPFK